MRRILLTGSADADPLAGSHRRPLRVSLLVSAGAAVGLLVAPIIHRPNLRLVWNASASVPLGLYRVEPGASPRIGDMVAVRPSPALGRFMAKRRYVEAGVPLIKPVVAASGATICRIGNRVTVDTRTVATALARDRFGRPLPIWSSCHRLRPDQLFLVAPAHADSFDSRYFGPVDARQIVGRAISVWTWP